MECRHCHQQKPITEFRWKNRGRGIRHHTCKACMCQWQAQWYLRNRQHHIALVAKRRRQYKTAARAYVLSYLAAHPCVDCGFTTPAALEFDHQEQKKMNVSNLLNQGYSLSMIRKEISKCQVRCANCHRIRTGLNQGWFKTGHP
jgi:hypothetical protein